MTERTYRRSNAEKFISAFDGIDESYICEMLDCISQKNNMNSKKRFSSGRVFAVAFSAAIVVILTVVMLIIKPNSPTSHTEHELLSYEIFCGYDDIDSGKETPGQRIALKCMSAYTDTLEIIVDAAMGDQYSMNQKFGVSPSYETFGSNGFPIFEVYVRELHSYKKTDNGEIKINKQNTPYTEKFTQEMLSSLDISYKIEDLSSYYHESVKLDFSNVADGTVGCIAFSFGWQYEREEPGESDCDCEELFKGQRRSLYYYKGEKGIVFSFDSADSAIEQYNNGCEPTKSIIDFDDGQTCCEKPIYLGAVDTEVTRHERCEVIEKTFELRSVFDKKK